MCGICGIAFSDESLVSREVIMRMNSCMMHRGPDGEGIFLERGIALAHRRLSIIDLESGAQPIFNEDRSVVVVLNGEIYNYRDLTSELISRGHRFVTHSDTETLVHLYEEHGIEMLSHLRGMFAFALYDLTRKSLYIVRDRFGIKPVYYWCVKGRLYFASEIKPLLETEYSIEVNRRALHLYFRSRFAHSDETIFKGIYRLPEGSYLKWRAGEMTLHSYYRNPVHFARDDGRDYESLFEKAFSSAIISHMVADVPVGAYLSGGVDSSVVVSEMTRLTGHPVRTFCVDFQHGPAEATDALRIAKALGCEHETVLCGTPELLKLPEVIKALEEPVGDGVVVAQYMLSRATRSADIKVVLTGDGADETLGGYQYLRAIIWAAAMGKALPAALCSAAAALAAYIPLPVIDFMAGVPLDIAGDARERLAYILRLMPQRDMRRLYDLILSLYCPAELKDVYTSEFFQEISRLPEDTFAGEPAGRTLTDVALSLQYRKWLPANINLKQDKLCMAHSVENRVPFLDHHFVELAVSLPSKVKFRGRGSKVILRQLAQRRLPGLPVGARKIPFHLPVQHFLKDPPVWAMVEENLSEERIKRRGLIRPEHARLAKDRARAGDYMWAKKLFALVILEYWYRIFVDRESVCQ
jgi:asparagine synthase (glutamine-hydrolysing)